MQVILGRKRGRAEICVANRIAQYMGMSGYNFSGYGEMKQKRGATMGEGEWFASFCGKLRIDKDKRESIAYRTGRIVGQLNNDLRKLDSKWANRFYVGSYGRYTAIPSVSDVDLLYELPAHLYKQFDDYMWNGQSSLLGLVRNSIGNTYPTSVVSGDGQVVVISFTDNVRFEILPAFANQGAGTHLPIPIRVGAGRPAGRSRRWRHSPTAMLRATATLANLAGWPARGGTPTTWT